MITAEILVTHGRFSGAPTSHVIKFSDLGKARAKFDELKQIIKDREARKNDVPSVIEIEGDAGSAFTGPLDSLASIGFVDLALADEHQKGMADTYPNIFKR